MARMFTNVSVRLKQIASSVADMSVFPTIFPRPTNAINGTKGAVAYQTTMPDHGNGGNDRWTFCAEDRPLLLAPASIYDQYTDKASGVTFVQPEQFVYEDVLY